jgi:anaerobic magnesium-protoporphyrin IX monomethyl ester cyclase
MVALTGPRRPRYDLDSLPFPARELYDHNAYKSYYQAHHGYTITSMITSRGCPFDCDFCSRPIFGRTFRSRSPKNIVDEMEVIAGYGYERIWLADDIFPLNRKIGLAVCDEIVKRGLDIEWECLCRADIMDYELARRMRRAGCVRVFFGLESGNDRVLRLMNKRLTVEKSRRAVHAVDAAGIRAGAFFILGYPGETNETMLDTIRFASSLPLDYFSFTIPYPIPGTGLYEKLKGRIIVDEWRKPRRGRYKHRLIYKSEFSPWKLRFGITKAHLQARMRRRLGSGYRLVGPVFEKATDLIFRAMR